MKAAWANLLTAFAGGGDVDKAMKNLADSVAIFLGNLIPRIKIVAQSLGKAFAKSLVPAVIKGLSKLGDAVPLLRPITSILSAIIRNFDRFKIIIVMLVSAFVVFLLVNNFLYHCSLRTSNALYVLNVRVIVLSCHV